MSHGIGVVRPLRARRALTFALAVTITLVDRAAVSAHRLDEYLQAARIDLQPGGVRIGLDLTPGAAVAESIIMLIDRNRDGAMSSEEQAAYAGSVLGALEIKVDGLSLPVGLESSPREPTTCGADADRRSEASAVADTDALPRWRVRDRIGR